MPMVCAVCCIPLRSMFGGECTYYTKLVADTTEAAVDRMVDHAKVRVLPALSSRERATKQSALQQYFVFSCQRHRRDGCCVP